MKRIAQLNKLEQREILMDSIHRQGYQLTLKGRSRGAAADQQGQDRNGHNTRQNALYEKEILSLLL
ncbi:hypothetical protein ACT7DA_21100 [Bacillus pacificus]